MTDVHPDDDEGDMASLVKLAGPRPVPSAERTAEARARVHAAWRAGLRRRRARTAVLFLVAAAGVAGLAMALVGRRDTPREPAVAQEPAPTAVAIAVLDAATERVEAEASGGWVRLSVGDVLHAGRTVRTAAGGAGFRVEDGRSVRLAAGSRMRWEAPGRLALASGAVYVDSAGAASSFEVRTPRAVVRETGTQFEVLVEETALRVRVREGRVAVAGGNSALDVATGTELRVDDRGRATRLPISSYGSEWSWVLALAPAFDMEGRTLHELLAWASRESGWELRYADAESRRLSGEARLRGSIRGARPDEAVAVIASAGLSHRLSEGVLSVGPSREAPEAP